MTGFRFRVLAQQARRYSLRPRIRLLPIRGRIAGEVLLGENKRVSHVRIRDVEVVFLGEALVLCEVVLEEELQLVLSMEVSVELTVARDLRVHLSVLVPQAHSSNLDFCVIIQGVPSLPYVIWETREIELPQRVVGIVRVEELQIAGVVELVIGHWRVYIGLGFYPHLIRHGARGC